MSEIPKIAVENMICIMVSFHALKNINTNIPEKEITGSLFSSGCVKIHSVKIPEPHERSGGLCHRQCAPRRGRFYGTMDVNLLRKAGRHGVQKPNPSP